MVLSSSGSSSTRRAQSVVGLVLATVLAVVLTGCGWAWLPEYPSSVDTSQVVGSWVNRDAELVIQRDGRFVAKRLPAGALTLDDPMDGFDRQPVSGSGTWSFVDKRDLDGNIPTIDFAFSKGGSSFQTWSLYVFGHMGELNLRAILGDPDSQDYYILKQSTQRRG
jgi:hypothetical protein